MKKIYALIIVVLFSSTFANAQEGVYGSFFDGINFVQSETRHETDLHFKPGYLVGGSLGYRWCEGLRVEGELSYRHNRLRDFEFECQKFHNRGHYSSFSLMANLLFDFDFSYWNCCSPRWTIIPYLGGGLGFANQRLKVDRCDLGLDSKKSGFAWQFIAGLMYKINPCSDLSIEYRFHRGRQHKFHDHDLNLVYKYHF